MTDPKATAPLAVLLGIVITAAAGGFAATFSSVAGYSDEGRLRSHTSALSGMFL